MTRDMVQIQRTNRHSFQGPQINIGRSQFNRSCGLKTTFDASYLYPIFLDDVLPGDTFTVSMTGFARIWSPLISPVMDNIELEFFWFYCPNRILWDNFVFMMGEHDAAGAQDTAYTIPVMDTGLTVDQDNVKTVHGLAGHLGLPHGLTTASNDDISALPFRMYAQIYNEWFADQNLTGRLFTKTTDNGADSPGAYLIARGNKRHDYFTSALPYLQKGTAQAAALAGTASVVTPAAAGTDVSVYSTTSTSDHKLDAGATHVDMSATVGTEATMALYADLSNPWSGGAAATVDINALRLSVAIQRLLEKDARGGTRYVEQVKSRFGVSVPDYRVQRPEYLGGGRTWINITPVANTSGVDAAAGPGTVDIHQGSLAGVGTGVVKGLGFQKSFTEHGYVMGLMRARGDITYFQGVDRHWKRSTRYDFYEPELANLGEQSILNSELWISNDANDDAVFGYQERWSEYRMKHSKIQGNFNPDVSGALDEWHLAEDFSTLPQLNTAFVNDMTPMSRVTAVTTEPDFLLDVWFDYRCARPIPVKSIPSLLARF